MRFCKSDTDSERLEKVGPAIIFLARDTHHPIRADHAELEHGVVTALTQYGVRSWPASELAVIKWLERAA